MPSSILICGFIRCSLSSFQKLGHPRKTLVSVTTNIHSSNPSAMRNVVAPLVVSGKHTDETKTELLSKSRVCTEPWSPNAASTSARLPLLTFPGQTPEGVGSSSPFTLSSERSLHRRDEQTAFPDGAETNERGGPPVSERAVLVEKEGCASVLTYPQRQTARVLLADGTVVTGNNRAEYEVCSALL